MSVHVVCATCQKMYFVADDGLKEKSHIYGSCPDCDRAERAEKEKRHGKKSVRKVQAGNP